MGSNSNRMQRINISLHPAVLSILEERITKARSAYIQRLICADMHIPDPQDKPISAEVREPSEIGLKTP